MRRSASVLLIAVVICATLPSLAQQALGDNERKPPDGWIESPAAKTNPGLWECAEYGGSVIVGLDEGAVRISKPPDEEAEEVPLPQYLKLSKEMIGRRSLLRTADGWLVGFDGGEFGGGLWWFNNEGDKNRKLLSENVHSIYQTTDGVFVLVGLAHLSLDDGKIYQFTETAEEKSVKPFADLGGSPEASTVDPDGQFIIATPRGVLAVDYMGSIRDLYKSDEGLTYPTSVVVDAAGDIFVGMRFFVLRLIRIKDGAYKPQWLMSKKCQSFKIVKGICTCADQK
jgi:hypothetical protein